MSKQANVETILEKLSARDLVEPAKKIAARHHLSLREMLGRSRARPAPQARAEFYGLLYRELGWSYPRIGALVGRDHTSVLYAVRGLELRECGVDVARTLVAS